MLLHHQGLAWDISIHAPARSATVFRVPFDRDLQDFNPRTRTECDWFVPSVTDPIRLFQSTHPHGVRRDGSAYSATGYMISIHAPARSATLDQQGPDNRLFISIHAPARSATSSALHSILLQLSISIHAPARSATSSRSWADSRAVFQSTHPHGVRLCLYHFEDLTSDISIHAPARSATHRDGDR